MKATKLEAQYTSESDHPDTVCAKCIHFVEGLREWQVDGCDRVKGEIAPKGWCKYWEEK